MEIPLITRWRDLTPLAANTLLILDIDETVLWFPSISVAWWEDLLLQLTAKHSAEKAQQLAREEWLRIVSTETPAPTDPEGFRDLNEEMDRTGGRIVFLTARMESFSYLTRRHLQACGVSKDVEIHFSSSKGKAIRGITARHPLCTNVVFVDDKMTNVQDVKQRNPTVHCFQWGHVPAFKIETYGGGR